MQGWVLHISIPESLAYHHFQNHSDYNSDNGLLLALLNSGRIYMHHIYEISFVMEAVMHKEKPRPLHESHAGIG